LNEVTTKVVILEQEKSATWHNFNSLLDLEVEKFETQKQISEHWRQVSESHQSQAQWYKKRERRIRWQRNVAVFLTMSLGALAVSN
jgi:hypothetical protein